MLITVDKETLLKSINIADSIISSKNINTILSNCLFNVISDEIEIISMDNEIAVRTRIDAVSDKAGSFTANGKKFSILLKELPNDELVLKINDKMLIDIKSKAKEIKGHYSLVGTSADEYPEIPEIVDENSIELDQGVFKEMIKKTIYAASTDTIKPVFNGMFFTVNSSGHLTAVATDSRRLSLISRPIDNSIDLGEGIIIPLKTVHEIYRLLENTGTCRFAVNKNQCFFKIGKTEIISRVVDGNFPNYRQVIPKEYSLEAVIETKRLLESVRRVMIFSREPANRIIMNFSANKLHIEANTPELGQAEEEIEIETKTAESFTLGINAQFLIDSLREFDSPSLKCGITGQMSPVSLIPEDDENFVSVIMPIQIKSANE
ncbi:MAG TPA: DNA polymerase III subunit beta [Spirochaetota bacterium]|nr:DNA polymerase III subunit beta [Spirochaetota bacterium]HPI88372.1 DNA polymerase III subunit beta [Spirochaetota bacterium]HPR46770.1 DNA polymerase III subunit beta [Spirochaetota bacterium]